MTGPDRTNDDQSSGAYALGALNAAEAAAFEKRLASDEELRAEVAGFTDTAALLGGAVPAVAPPPHLKAGIMAALDSTPQLSAELPAPAVEADPEPGPQGETLAPVTDLAAARAGSASARRRRPARLALFVGAAAAAAAIFVGGTFVGAQLGGADPAPASAIQDLATLSAAPDMARTVIALPDGGTAALMTSEQTGLSAVVLDDAKPLPDGEVYQAWLIRDGKPVDAGVMPSAQSAVRLLQGEYHAGDSVALTVEPAGGSATPTGTPIVFAS